MEKQKVLLFKKLVKIIDKYEHPGKFLKQVIGCKIQFSNQETYSYDGEKFVRINLKENN